MIDMRIRRSHPRGQTFPTWIGSILGAIGMMSLILNYSNVLSTQLRAQTAAEAMANSLASLQAQQFNQMNVMLYSADVEEYRLRHLLEMLRITANYSGGCNHDRPVSCGSTWTNLTSAYARSLYRYDQDARFLNQITHSMNITNVHNDAKAVLLNFQTGCTAATPTSNQIMDCSLKYAISGWTTRTQEKEAKFFPQQMLLPSYVPTLPITKANPQVFAPVAVEVAVCKLVPPVFQSLWPLKNLPPVTVVARAASTNAMVVQDWLQPGSVKNVDSGYLYQPKELYGNGNQGWYTVNYGGNAATVDPTKNTITNKTTVEELSVRVGWWGPVPIYPFMGNQTVSQLFSTADAKACGVATTGG